MDDLDLLIDLHLRNDRQAPGDDAETLRALQLARLDDAGPIDLADLGCGTGASALVLARALDASVTAIDAAPAFIDRLRERANDTGLGDRISARVGRMERLPFDDESLDLIWSEGAIYNIGFDDGVRAWRRFLRPNGVLAVSELSWTSPTRPGEVHDHWTAAYPGIRTVSANLRSLEAAGYRPQGFFFLPRSCWEERYYAPLRAAVPAFLERHGRSEAAMRVAAAERAEADLHRAWGAWYGYGFYIARNAGDDSV